MSELVYFVQMGNHGPIKIGITGGNPLSRLVKMQSDCPWKLNILGAIPGNIEIEREFHKRFAAHRTQGEWFAAADEVLTVIRSALREPGAWSPPPKKIKRVRHDHPLCRYRGQRKISLKNLAAKVGTTHATLSRLESGKQTPRVGLVRRLSSVTGIPAAAFLPDLAKLFQPEAAK
jgi:DNA-binding XRE family transcriptional regulator